MPASCRSLERDAGRSRLAQLGIGLQSEAIGHAVRSGGWKLIYNRSSRSGELYNLAQDPGETRNLVDLEPERARDLLRMIAAQDRENAKRSRRVKGNEDLPEDVVEGLKSLGYIR